MYVEINNIILIHFYVQLFDLWLKKSKMLILVWFVGGLGVSMDPERINYEPICRNLCGGGGGSNGTKLWRTFS